MIKTVTLKGSELKVEGLGGFNTFVQNLGSVVLYASKFPGISAGADNVAEIPAGSGKLISTTNGTVYLLGTGKTELTGLDYEGVIASGGTAVYSVGEGGGTFEGGASFMEFVGYADAHDELTLSAAREYSDLKTQGKADKTEIPTSLPANGGNAATVNGHTVGADVPEDAVFTDTVVDISGKPDAENPVCTGTFSLNRKPNTTIGNYSFAAGYLSTASGNHSLAMGTQTMAEGEHAYAEGHSTLARGKYSHAEGRCTGAKGDYSHSEGNNTQAEGSCSHAGGEGTYAVRNYSTVIGLYNKKDLSEDSGSMFIIGNGTGTVNSKRSNLFRIADTGEVYATGAFNAEGADYAEYVKPWFDDNADNEDRRGYFVTIRGGRLYKAEPGDYIVGITSGNPGVIGNGDEDWAGRFMRDEFGSYIYEETEMETDSDEKTFVTARKQNPDYDAELRYVPRRERPEWSAVGMIGVLPLRDDGSCVPGGFAKCGEGGVATNAGEWECHKTFFVIERVSDNIIKVEMR